MCVFFMAHLIHLCNDNYNFLRKNKRKYKIKLSSYKNPFLKIYLLEIPNEKLSICNMKKMSTKTNSVFK